VSAVQKGGASRAGPVVTRVVRRVCLRQATARAGAATAPGLKHALEGAHLQLASIECGAGSGVHARVRAPLQAGHKGAGGAVHMSQSQERWTPQHRRQEGRKRHRGAGPAAGVPAHARPGGRQRLQRRGGGRQASHSVQAAISRVRSHGPSAASLPAGCHAAGLPRRPGPRCSTRRRQAPCRPAAR
jgi:hypothetical protein